MSLQNSFATFYGANYPAEADVLLGVSYGDPQNSLVGTFQQSGAIVPSVNDVRLGVAVGASTGNLEIPGVADVRLGVNYGTLGLEYTGTLVVQPGTTASTDYLEFNRTDDYLGSNALQITGTFPAMTGTLQFAVVDEAGTNLIETAATKVDDSTLSVELTREQTKIPSDVYRYSIREIASDGQHRTVTRGFASVAMVYQELP
jgi:hypothetical protein